MTQQRPLPTQHPETWSPASALVITPRECRAPEFGHVIVPIRPMDGRGVAHGKRQDAHCTAPPDERDAVAAALYHPLGLRGNPFAPMQPHDDAYPAIAQAAQHLADWASRAKTAGPLAVVTGAARSGRTTVLQSAMATLAVQNPELRVLDVAWHARLTAGGLLRVILAAAAPAEKSTGRTTLAMIAQIREIAAGEPVVLLLDGPGALDGQHLDVVRSLLHGEPSLRIIVTGSPDLMNRIRRRQSLADRVSHHHAIAPLDAHALGSWLQDRITTAAIDPHARQAVHITPEAVAIIAGWSAGSIGPAIELANECLLESIARGRRIVDDGIAHDVVREFMDRARHAARHAAEASALAPVIQAHLDLAPPSPAQTEVCR